MAKEAVPVIDDIPPSKEALAEACKHVVWDDTGKQVSFVDLLKPVHPGGKVIMIVIRHYGCGMCQDYCTELVKLIKPDQLEAAKVNLLIIGCGSWTLAKPYEKILDLPWPVYSAPGKEVYIALGMTLRTLDRGKAPPSYVKRSLLGGIIGSIANGISMGKVANFGDIKQLGGEFIVSEGSEGPTFEFTHRMKHTRDHVEVADLMRLAGVQPAQAKPAPTKTTQPATAAEPEPAQTTASTATTVGPTTPESTPKLADTEPAESKPEPTKSIETATAPHPEPAQTTAPSETSETATPAPEPTPAPIVSA